MEKLRNKQPNSKQGRSTKELRAEQNAMLHHVREGRIEVTSQSPTNQILQVKHFELRCGRGNRYRIFVPEGRTGLRCYSLPSFFLSFLSPLSLVLNLKWRLLECI